VFKRMLNGIKLVAAEVVPFPTGDELERRKKEAADPERKALRKKAAERRREEEDRKRKNQRIVDGLKRDP
jgi:hypothetical protein